MAPTRGRAAGSFANEIDLVDPDYKYPSVLRGSLGYDHDLGFWDMIGTVEFFGSSTIKDISYNNLKFMYDPSLDDLGGAFVNSCYVIDTKHLYPYAMEEEWGKDHAPARPHDVYALFKARTYTGQLCADQLNCHALFQVT